MCVQLTFISMLNIRNVFGLYLEVQWWNIPQELNSCLSQLTFGEIGFIIPHFDYVTVSKTLWRMLSEDLTICTVQYNNDQDFSRHSNAFLSISRRNNTKLPFYFSNKILIILGESIHFSGTEDVYKWYPI